MNITVVTHTAGNRPEELERCKRSVSLQLQPGDRHLIVQTTDLMAARWASLQLGEYITWVDDDDYVLNDSVQLCKAAIGDQGVAFTNESIGDGLVNRSKRWYSDIATVPGTIHHLCLFNTSKIDPRVWEDYVRIGSGLEWLIKGYVALKHGAVHVPIDGYRWTQHPAQHSKVGDWESKYRKAFPLLQRQLEEYGAERPDGLIPTFVTS